MPAPSSRVGIRASTSPAAPTRPALRGLTVQSTLSVADGLRIAPYPLADDGQRNFVDLNTIPSAIVERIEVLRDGASSTYGADAIAGVINVITKKEIQGLHIGGATAMSEQGGGDENRVDVTWGFGDLESQGYNFYVSAEYQKQDPLWARDREYPFNSTDLQGICGASGSCMTNNNWNGVTAELGNTPGSFNGLISVPGVVTGPTVRPRQVPSAAADAMSISIRPRVAASGTPWPSSRARYTTWTETSSTASRMSRRSTSAKSTCRMSTSCCSPRSSAPGFRCASPRT